MNRHDGTWKPNKNATHFIEVWGELGKWNYTSINAIGYLQGQLNMTKQECFETLCVWHITPLPPKNKN